jgi:hypothetical protein
VKHPRAKHPREAAARWDGDFSQGCGDDFLLLSRQALSGRGVDRGSHGGAENRTSAGVTQERPVVLAATENPAVRHFGRVPKAPDTRIADAHMQFAPRIAAERVIVLEGLHTKCSEILVAVVM